MKVFEFVRLTCLFQDQNLYDKDFSDKKVFFAHFCQSFRCFKLMNQKTYCKNTLWKDEVVSKERPT